ncbi:MAG: DUF4040 domain-containing protein [Caldilineales bacterium]|nr:DUF4040 domain-containing protein [Caldilineales bacterium]
MMTPALLPLPIALALAAAAVSAAVWLTSLHRRVAITPLAQGLAAAPLAAFVLLLWMQPAIAGGKSLSWSVPWIPALGLSLSLYLDGLSALFALIVSGIGVLVVWYSGYYFQGDDGNHARFLTFLLLFMASMLGVVMAGDVITLFIFWEGTSITSFLLVAYKTKDPQARAGGFQALFITGGGGIALLAGLLMVAHVAGDTSFATILASGEALRASPLYPALLLLIAFGAFTKSAQFPAHIWLPRAMTAPTPASAFLHSATMVKAGIFLMARLNPALGGTDLWFSLLTGFGMATMLIGAYLGLKQNDLKGLLAYSTVSQLGVMMAMIGQNIDIAFKALVISVLAHALYKSALFLVAGIVDHETGTRDLRRLGGLRRAMPASFAVAFVAGLSMAGLPPLFGFLAKETLLATTTHPNVPPSVSNVMALLAVTAGALLLVQAGLLVTDTFLGRPRDPDVHGHEAPTGMWLAPAIPAAFSLVLGLAPGPRVVADFLANAAQAAYGEKVKVSLALWTGLNVPLALSLVAIAVGLLIFVNRTRVRGMMALTGDRWGFQHIYNDVLRGIDRLASLATQLQGGKLRTYLAIMLASALLLIVAAVSLHGVPLITAETMRAGLGSVVDEEVGLLRALALLMVVGSAAATIVLRRDFAAVIVMAAAGLGIALLMVLEPAPDVGLVQVVVDTLSTVILVLALTRLPRQQRERAYELNFVQSRPALIRNAALAVGVGVVVTSLTLIALTSRPRLSVPTPFFEANAKPLTGAKDIVGAVVVDFRGFDTLLEITVFAIAGLGIYTLLRYTARTAEDHVAEAPPTLARHLRSRGIGGLPTSPFVHALALVVLPLAMIVAVTHVLYGHDQPGDGFTAGVIVSLAVAFWYVVFGYEEAKARLPWLKSHRMLALGLLLAIVNAAVAALIAGSPMAPVDFGKMLGLPLPAGMNLSTSFLFELAIGLTVLGSASLMLDTLGHPGDR